MMSERGRRFLVNCVFLLVSLGGITVIWNLPSPLSDFSILLGIAWVYLTSRSMRWLVIRIGWSTKEREG